MEKLEKSLREHGYDDNRPIVVMLCRSGGKIDSVRQGHHRVSACLACGVEKMTVEFAAAGALPACFKRQQPADGRHNVSMVSIQPGELLGGGSRRTCHALPDPSLCLKSYRTDDELEEFSKKLAAKGATPLKPAVVREIHMNRFLRAKNTNVQEYEAWCSMKERLPSDVMSVFPSKMELVCDSVRGWSIVEERVRNFDGRPLTRISQEALHAAPQLRSRLLSAFCALRDDLSRHHVCFFDPPNVMVQWLTQDEFRLRIVDFEPAVRTLLPVDKLFPFLLAMKVRRRFNRWLRHIQESGFVV